MNKYLKLSLIFTGLWFFLILVGNYPFLNQYFEIFNFFDFRFGGSAVLDYAVFVFIALAAITGVVAIFQMIKSTSKQALFVWIWGVGNVLCLLLATTILYDSVVTFGF